MDIFTESGFFFFLLLRLYNFRMFVANFVLCSYIFITFNWMKYRLKFFFSLKIMIYSMNKYFSFYLKSFKDIFTVLAEINVNIFLIDISIFQQQLNITLVLSFTFFFFFVWIFKNWNKQGKFSHSYDRAMQYCSILLFTIWRIDKCNLNERQIARNPCHDIQKLWVNEDIDTRNRCFCFRSS